MKKYLIPIMAILGVTIIASGAHATSYVETDRNNGQDYYSEQQLDALLFDQRTFFGTSSDDEINSILMAQAAFSIELSRLINERKSAFQVALTMTGLTRTDALWTANNRFALGLRIALASLNEITYGGGTGTTGTGSTGTGTTGTGTTGTGSTGTGTTGTGTTGTGTTGTGTTGTGTTGTGTTGTGTTGTGTTGTGTTGTGTTGTGSTGGGGGGSSGTGTTGTGTTGTGSTGTGTTGTGTTGTGSTGTGTVGSGNTLHLNLILAQETFANELVRLVAERKSSFFIAQSLAGSLRVDALRAATSRFSQGFKSALSTLKIAKQMARKIHLGRLDDIFISSYNDNGRR